MIPELAIDALAVAPDSQLDTLAGLNPSACVRFADALLYELDAAMAACSLATSATSIDEQHRQIHALKNMVCATGCQELLDACAALRDHAGDAAQSATSAAAFHAIAQATRHLVATYRRGLVADQV